MKSFTLESAVLITQSNGATEKSRNYIRNSIFPKGESQKGFFKKILFCFNSVAPLLRVSNYFFRFAPVLAAVALFLIVAGASHAGPVKTHVAEFNITGVPNGQDLKQTLPGILASRLSPEQVLLVEKPEQAEVLLNGSYALFGKMFSLDVLIKSRESGSMVKVFEQGEGLEDVIPAVGRLARKIDAELVKRTATAVPAVPKPALIPAVAAVQSPLSAAALAPVKAPYVIRPEASTTETAGNWSSAPLDGQFSSIAVGRTLANGERELFIADERSIRAYRKGSELKLVAEIAIPSPGKILAIDTADLDKDGSPELYISVIDREFPASRVIGFNGTAFTVIAENQPWFFRGIGNDVISRTIYVQEIEASGKYYGAVKELVKSETGFSTKNPQKLPRSGNIFNFNHLGTASGTGYFVILDEDGYLVVYSPDGSEGWKSSEKYGGSENFFTNESQSHSRSSGDFNRWIFLEQRLTVLKDGTLLVPHNEGTFSFGNNRSFNRHSMFALEWSGAVLREKWHTRQSPGYLADYAFDQTSGELLLLEVVQKSGLFSKGKSVISINRID